MNRILVIIFLFLSTLQVNAQCNVNTSICNGGNAGPFSFVPLGNHVSTCLDFFGPNAGYIILNISQGGNLNMLIDGNSSSGFIDVAVFNIPQGVPPCTAINSNSNQILCNYASSASGCNQFGGQFGCPSNVGTVPVTAGQQLMIVAENWSGSSSSFTLQMSSAPGSAQAGLPNATINPVSDLCVSANPVQLSAPSMGGTWSGSGVSATGMFNPATAGIGIHQITYSVGLSPCIDQDTIDITVVDNPTISLTSNSPVCSGETIIFTVDSILNSTYLWSGPNGFNSTSTAVLIYNASPTDAGTYTVTVNHAGCTSTASTDVVVNPNVSINLDAVAPLCEKDSIVFNHATVTSPSGNSYTGYWFGEGITDSISGAFDPLLAGIGTHTVYYEVTGACGSIDSLDIVVKPHPKFNLLSLFVADCSPLQTTLMVASDLTNDSTHIDFGNGSVGDSLGLFPLTYTNNGNSVLCYPIQVSGISQGCATDTIFPNYFCVYPNPIATPTVSASKADVYNPTFQFTDQSENIISSFWSFGDGSTSSLTNPTHTYSQDPNDYTVVLAVENEYECKDTSNIQVRVVEDILFYVPNSFTPDGDEFNNVFRPILGGPVELQSYTLLVYNRWGQTVFESHDPIFGWDGTFGGTMVPDGTYTWMITFQAKETSETFKKYGFVNLIK